MRRPMIAGNWKMNTTASLAESLVKGLLPLVRDAAHVDIVVAPPFVYLQQVAGLVSGGPVALGAQDMSPEKSGAWTGEVSGPMLRDVGCTYVIIGHSERRQFFSETDESVNKKVHAALGEGLLPIVCVGETLTQRKDGVTLDLVGGQVRKALANV
ncbi:MAG: triose-phosphate isomerase family protein, partial [Thermodesulfobacteriota bacterium]